MPFHGVPLPGVILHAHPVELVLCDGTANQFTRILRAGCCRREKGQQDPAGTPSYLNVSENISHPCRDLPRPNFRLHPHAVLYQN